MPRMWTDEEIDKLHEVDDKISKSAIDRSFMTNRELQQAIRETFEMWRGAGNAHNSHLGTHLNTLLNLQLIRARGGYIDK